MFEKINSNTFRFHFLLIYGIATLISLTLIISSLVIINRLTSRYNFYAEVTEPLKYQIQAFNIDINKQAALLEAYSISGNEDLRKEGSQLLNVKLPSRIKLMREMVERLNDPLLIVKVDDLELNLKKLQKNGEQIGHGNDDRTKEVIEKEFIPGVEKLSLILKEFNADLYHRSINGFEKVIESFDRYKYWVVGAFVLFITFFYLIISKTRIFVIKSIRGIEIQINEIAKGNIPEDMPAPENELSTIVSSVNYLQKNLRNVKEFSLKVGKGDFDSNISVFENEGELGQALAGMRQSLKDVDAADKKRDWVNQGLAKFHNIIRQNTLSLQDLCYEVLSDLVKYVNANQGGVFILEEEGDHRQFLELKASFAYNRKKFKEKRLEPGQGLVGQAYREQESIYLKEIPEQYVSITSGLGDATPRVLFVQPLLNNEQVVGVIELASFHEFEDHVRDFIAKVCESLASAVATVKNTEQNEKILQESQSLAEQLRSQEEELRQNTEELQATQEEMHRRIQELEAENKRLIEEASNRK